MTIIDVTKIETMTYQQLIKEINELRIITERQNFEIHYLKEKLSLENVQSGEDWLIKSLNSLINNVNTKIKPPTLAECKHPKKFLEQLKKFFELNFIFGNDQLKFLEIILEGNEEIWFNIHKDSIIDFNDFQCKFLEEFFSVPIKVQNKIKWLNSRFDSTNDSLKAYFLSQVVEAKYFEPEMEPYEVHFTIIQQLPVRVRELMAVVNFSDFDMISSILSQLDSIYADENFDVFIDESDNLNINNLCNNNEFVSEKMNENFYEICDLNFQDRHTGGDNPEKCIEQYICETDPIDEGIVKQNIGERKIDFISETLVNKCHAIDDVHLSPVLVGNVNKACSDSLIEPFRKDDSFDSDVNSTNCNYEYGNCEIKETQSSHIVQENVLSDFEFLLKPVNLKMLFFVVMFEKFYCFLLNLVNFISNRDVDIFYKLNSDLRKRKPPDKCTFAIKGVFPRISLSVKF